MNQAISVCPLCSSNKSHPFDQRYFMKVLVTNRVCQGCGLVFQSPRLTTAEADEFHKSQYRRIHQVGSMVVDPREIAIQKARADVFLDLFTKTVEHVSSHLDIGCSGGPLMQAFERRFGCKTIGVEIDTTYRSYASMQGLQVFETIDELPIDMRYDVISMSHVLEHISDPVEFLVRLKQNFLEAEGWLYLEVPNLYAHDCFEPGHLVSFSGHTLVQVLRKAGYRVNRLVYHGKPRSKIIPLYLNILAQPTDNKLFSIKSEKMVYIKRKSGRALRRLAEYFLPNLAKLKISGV